MVWFWRTNHQLQLPQDALAVLKGREDLMALLDGHQLPGAADLGLDDAAVGACGGERVPAGVGVLGGGWGLGGGLGVLGPLLSHLWGTVPQASFHRV